MAELFGRVSGSAAVEQGFAHHVADELISLGHRASFQGGARTMA
jgi:hypothetical protein